MLIAAAKGQGDDPKSSSWLSVGRLILSVLSLLGREAASSLSVGNRKRGAYVGRQTDSGVGTKDGGWDDVSPNYIYIYILIRV